MRTFSERDTNGMPLPGFELFFGDERNLYCGDDPQPKEVREGTGVQLRTGWWNEDGKQTMGVEADAHLARQTFQGKHGSVTVAAPNANAGFTHNDDVDELGAQANLVEASGELRGKSATARAGVSLGVGAAARLHHSDDDGDLVPEVGFGADVGPVSVDYKTETPGRDAALAVAGGILMGPVGGLIGLGASRLFDGGNDERWSPDLDLDIVESRMRKGYSARQSPVNDVSIEGRRALGRPTDDLLDPQADLEQLNVARLLAGRSPLLPSTSETPIADLAVAESRMRAGYPARGNFFTDGVIDANRKAGISSAHLIDEQADFDEMAVLRAAKAQDDRRRAQAALFKDLF